jgi:predicted nuclease of predicted toxin-antitoxin system
VKILLDECVPLPLRDLLGGSHDSISVQQRGWTGIRNGDLLRLATREFDLFITSDQSIRYQQNLASSPIAILELSSNDLRRIRASARMIQSEIAAIQPGEYRRVAIP